MQLPHEAEGEENDSCRVLSRPQLIGTITSVFLLLLLASLDQTIVGTAMPRIVAKIGGFDLYAWVTTAYLLTETAAIPIFGKLSDLYGRKPFLLLGVAIFLTGSALAGAAGNLPLSGSPMLQLVLARSVQGRQPRTPAPASAGRARSWSRSESSSESLPQHHGPDPLSTLVADKGHGQ